jgi:uncharacterized protein (TIGR02001 family)
MKMSLVASLVGLIACSAAWAEEEKPANEVTANVSVVSDYRYRGISQTRLRPALQGGVDYVHNPSGWYAGTWLSTIQWIRDTPGAGGTAVETDFYGGKRGELPGAISYDVGLLAFVFIDNGFQDAGMKNPNTLEAYAQLGWGPAYIKYNHAVTTLFGYTDSKNSGYLDIGANVELSNKFILNLHAGYQKVRGIASAEASYGDFKVGVTKEFAALSGVSVSLAAITTNARRSFYVSPVQNKYLGKDTVVLSVTKTF